MLSAKQGRRGLAQRPQRRSPPRRRVLRTVGDDHEPRAFRDLRRVAIASIGKLPDTLPDRSVIIDLKRRMRNEPITPFRLDRAEHLDELARQIAAMGDDNAERVAATIRRCRTASINRAADNWRPLLAIADVAGGEWPERARKAARAAAAEDDDEGSRLEMLLGDIRTIFANAGTVDRHSVRRSGRRPWSPSKAAHGPSTGRTGKPITPEQARPDAQAGRASHRKLDSGRRRDRARGLRPRRQFAEAFDRYSSPLRGVQTVTASQCDETGTSDTFQTVPPRIRCTVRKCEKSNNDGLVDGCTVAEGETGEESMSTPRGCRRAVRSELAAVPAGAACIRKPTRRPDAAARTSRRRTKCRTRDRRTDRAAVIGPRAYAGCRAAWDWTAHAARSAPKHVRGRDLIGS